MVIIGGNILSAAGPALADIHLAGEKIAAILPRGPMAGFARDPGAEASGTAGSGEVCDPFDAKGRWVLPGGVDAHTHFGMPLAGGITSLGWRESSTAALLGGTTTVIDFANPDQGQLLGAAVDRWRQAADGSCLCDYGLHVTVPETPSERLGELAALVAAGLPTFKGFLAYKGRLMLEPAPMRSERAHV
jgi:dihydropyrimidinase